MDQRGFKAHTVKWALALVVDERREVIMEARWLARVLRQPLDAMQDLRYFGPDHWEEIARRIEMNGHTPVPTAPLGGGVPVGIMPWLRSGINSRAHEPAATHCASHGEPYEP